MGDRTVIVTLLSDEVLLYSFTATVKVTVKLDTKNSEIVWKAGAEEISG